MPKWTLEYQAPDGTWIVWILCASQSFADDMLAALQAQGQRPWRLVPIA